MISRVRIIPKKIKTALLTRLLSVFFICFFCFSLISALDRERSINQFYHTAWRAKDGAPSQISSLAQTADGYLWIGSALGLFRFDGVTFEQYEPPDGTPLPSHNTYALMATPDGGLWISFRPSGLGFLKDGKLQIFKRPEELPKSQVYCFGRTPDGRIWAGTQTGLALFNGTGWDEIGTERNFQPSRVRTMFTDRGGTLWVSKDDAIVYLTPGANSFQELSRQTEYALGFAQSADDRVWAAKFMKPVVPVNVSPKDAPIIKLQSNALLFDREGSLWLAAYPNGVKRIRFPEQLKAGTIEAGDARIETFDESNGLSGDQASNILEDREGNIWVGSNRGLDRFRYSSIIPVAMPESNQRLTMVAVPNGEIWSGNNYDSLLHIAGGRIETKFFKPLEPMISSYYQTGNKDIWWGVRGGILHQSGDDFKFYPKPQSLIDDYIWEVFRGADDGFWVNYGDAGLIYFKDGVWGNRKPPAGLPERGPSASFEDDRQRTWLGYTENRVYVIDGEQVQGYTSANGIEIGRIKVIRGRSENYWFGGELGLALFKDGSFHTVKTDGKPFGAVSGIVLTENGDVWLNETHGVINVSADEVNRLKENPERAIKYRLYDYEDNLPGGPQMNFTVSTAVETTDKRLWFATDYGLASIDPARLEKNNYPPPLVIKSVFADEKLYQPSAEEKLPAGTTSLQINYTATSLSIPERVQFKYRLEGLDKQWTDAGTRRTAYYTNLAPGKYRFQVIAANNDGVWNEQGANLEFEILPKFYQSNWFLLLCLAACGGLIWMLYHWRLYQVKARLCLLYEERIAERTRIAQDLHDTLLQNIVSVSMHLESAVGKLAPDSPAAPRLERMREMMREIIKEGRHTVNGLRSLSRRTGRDLEEEISLISQQLNVSGGTNFRLRIDGIKSPLNPTVHDEIYHICREALANAFRHSGASLIEVDLEYTKKTFRILIRDDGTGINEDILRSGRDGHWGLSGMKERAAKINGKFRVYARPSGGTEIELEVSNRLAFDLTPPTQTNFKSE